ncbi:MAG: hypothetical protein QOI86_3021, partial [Actinomycetota bacterium]|nr:hypothetical protein [Actinomycetota bacterium]
NLRLVALLAKHASTHGTRSHSVAAAYHHILSEAVPF